MIRGINEKIIFIKFAKISPEKTDKEMLRFPQSN